MTRRQEIAHIVVTWLKAHPEVDVAGDLRVIDFTFLFEGRMAPRHWRAKPQYGPADGGNARRLEDRQSE